MIEVVITPEHLFGAKVDYVKMEPGHYEGIYPNGEQKILILDRHNSNGVICIPDEDCMTEHVPLCCWAPENAEPAHKLYAVYNLGGEIERAGLAWNDTQVPSWNQLLQWYAEGDKSRQGVVDKWRAVAKYCMNNVLK